MGKEVCPSDLSPRAFSSAREIPPVHSPADDGREGLLPCLSLNKSLSLALEKGSERGRGGERGCSGVEEDDGNGDGTI